MSKEFDLGDILSITTEHLVSPNHIGGVYDILGFMLGRSLWTHELPSTSRQCSPELLRQHPQLSNVTFPVKTTPWTEQEVVAWLDEQKLVYGETLPVEPLLEG